MGVRFPCDPAQERDFEAAIREKADRALAGLADTLLGVTGDEIQRVASNIERERLSPQEASVELRVLCRAIESVRVRLQDGRL